MMRNRVLRFGLTMFIVGVLVLGLSSCGMSHISGQAVTHGLAHIERIEVFILESFPVQVHVYIAGVLQDGCTTRDAVTQERSAMTFIIRVTTRRPTNAACDTAVYPFEERVALDVYGLPAGTYYVDVNGVQESFVLDVDNALP